MTARRSDAAAANRSARLIRVIAVSPGDVVRERKRLAAVVEELNGRLAFELGFELRLWRWETDASPGLHLKGPQGLIDDAMALEDADVVVGIFWNRLGTPTQTAKSGTAHELLRAWELWRKTGRPQVFVYFGERKARLKTTSEAAQLLALFEFRDAMPPEQMRWQYGTLHDFEREVRQHLTSHIMKLARTPEPPEDQAVSLATVAGFMELWKTLMSAAAEEALPTMPVGNSDDVDAFHELSDEQKDAVAAAIADLPEAEKLVIALTYYEQMSASEIASVLQQPVGTVRALHAHAVQRLRKRLQALL